MQNLNQVPMVKLVFIFLYKRKIFLVFVFFIDEQTGTIEFDAEGERITVNFDQKLEVNDYFSLKKILKFFFSRKEIIN